MAISSSSSSSCSPHPRKGEVRRGSLTSDRGIVRVGNTSLQPDDPKVLLLCAQHRISLRAARSIVRGVNPRAINCTRGTLFFTRLSMHRLEWRRFGSFSQSCQRQSGSKPQVNQSPHVPAHLTHDEGRGARGFYKAGARRSSNRGSLSPTHAF